jgi:hypothetical protein
MDWALFRGLRANDSAAGVRALDIAFAYFKQRGSLTPLFNHLNRTHFDGMLRPYRILRQPADYPADNALLMGSCIRSRNRITITYGQSPREERQTLLHEMAHAATETEKASHGPAFQRELWRLAALGERWARQEALVYGRPGAELTGKIPWTAKVISQLWTKHGSAWMKREYNKRSRAASKAALTRLMARRREQDGQ